jgi:hypothetical protein
MTIETWKEEFYTEEAYTAANGTDEECITHSIKKWEGALPENLKKHQLTKDYKTLNDKDYDFDFDGSTCALCQKYNDITPDNEDDDIDTYCYSDALDQACPIVRMTGDTCDQIYFESLKDPTLMLDLLKRVKEYVDNEQ